MVQNTDSPLNGPYWLLCTYDLYQPYKLHIGCLLILLILTILVHPNCTGAVLF